MGNGLLQTVRKEIKYALEHPGSELWYICNEYRDDPSLEQKVIEHCCKEYGHEWGIKYVPEINEGFRRTEFLFNLQESLRKNHPDIDTNVIFDKWLMKHGFPYRHSDLNSWVKLVPDGRIDVYLDIWDFIDDTNLPYGD